MRAKWMYKGCTRDVEGIPKGYPRDTQGNNTVATPSQPRRNTLDARSIQAHSPRTSRNTQARGTNLILIADARRNRAIGLGGRARAASSFSMPGRSEEHT